MSPKLCSLPLLSNTRSVPVWMNFVSRFESSSIFGDIPPKLIALSSWIGGWGNLVGQNSGFGSSRPVRRRRIDDRSVQNQAGGTKQGIHSPFERANHGPNAAPLYQPAAGAGFPLAASVAHHAIELAWAAQRDPSTERAELDGTDPWRHGAGRSHEVILRQMRARRHHL